MTHDEMIDVIKAHRDGKQIQVRPHSFSDWSDNVYPVWDFDHCDYRIKPEEPVKLKLTFIEILQIKDYTGDHLCAGGLRLDIWMSHKNFVGFKYPSGAILPYPVIHNETPELGKFGVEGYEIYRATHVVVGAR